MKFVVDAQLPPSLADWLKTQGFDADHVSSLLSLDASDDDIWRLARTERRIIVTKDRDFALWASDRREGPQVVWLRIGNATTRSLLIWLTPKWPLIQDRLNEGVHLIEVRA
ncbi:hypothetical protein SH203_01320 [Brevundimonas sp. SH203]|uniref:DUF5615 family PIN-like protein n=1 Tax=Brevundimonas sp. SH203 TaxID=345167 RepID=UPI0009C9D689|nr:DUF5615 family PIN-like protein [Brevundimonas sp. SH203]GAW40918.1 hypothetical protein SH203_01320 [Brevundimonas sp. SH203]